MAQLDSRASYRALAIIFGILVLFLVIYSDLQARLRRLGTTDIAQTVSVTAVTSPSITATEFLTYQKLMIAMLLVAMIIIAAMLVSILFTSMARKRRLTTRSPESERSNSRNI